MLKSNSRLTIAHCGLIITFRFKAYSEHWISVPGRNDRTLHFSGLHHQSGICTLKLHMFICKKREATELLLPQKRFPLKWITLSFHNVLATNNDHLNCYSDRLHWLTTKDTAGILEAELILPRYNGTLCLHLYQLPSSWIPLLAHLREEGKEGSSILLHRASR